MIIATFTVIFTVSFGYRFPFDNDQYFWLSGDFFGCPAPGATKISNVIKLVIVPIKLFPIKYFTMSPHGTLNANILLPF